MTVETKPFKSELVIFDKNSLEIVDRFPLSKVGMFASIAILRRLPVAGETNYQLFLNCYKNDSEYKQGRAYIKTNLFNEEEGIFHEEIVKEKISHELKTLTTSIDSKVGKFAIISIPSEFALDDDNNKTDIGGIIYDRTLLDNEMGEGSDYFGGVESLIIGLRQESSIFNEPWYKNLLSLKGIVEYVWIKLV